MDEYDRKSRTEAQLRTLNRLAEIERDMIRMMTQFIRDAAPGAEAKSYARGLDRLTRGLRQTIALRDKIAAGQASRAARSAMGLAALSPPMPARAVEERQRPRLVYSRSVDACAKSTDRGPPNG